MPDPGRNRILIWMLVLIAVNQLGFGSIVPVIALYARSFGVLQSAIGLAVGIYGLARFLVALPAGQLADRIGRRSVLALGGLVTAAGNLLCGYAPDFPTFVVARFVSGAGAALVVTTGTIVLADITTPVERGRMMSVYQGTFLFSAAAGAIAAVLAFFYVRETRDLPGARATAAVAGAAPAAFAAQLRLLVGQVGFALVGLTAFMGAVARTGGLFSVIPVLARDRLALTADRIRFWLWGARTRGRAVA